MSPLNTCFNSCSQSYFYIRCRTPGILKPFAAACLHLSVPSSKSLGDRSMSFWEVGGRGSSKVLIEVPANCLAALGMVPGKRQMILSR